MKMPFVRNHLWLFCLSVALAAGPARAQTNLVISEFMASNASTLTDEDGESSDWIEIQNRSTFTVNLEDWSLTDQAGDLTQWRFPATNVPPAGFLVVFASGKNRRVPGAPLHTNYKLDANGEYLALVAPDGVTVVSEFTPRFPPQFPDVSFGFGMNLSETVLVPTNAAVRVRVPTDGSLGLDWTNPEFDDSSWLAGTSGVGFEAADGQAGDNGAAGVVLASGPLAYFRFSETSGTTAANQGSLGAAVNGSYLGAVALRQLAPRPPQFAGFETNNTAAAFNGSSSRVQVPDNPAFDFTGGEFTFELWFFPVDVSRRADLVTYKGAGGDFGIQLGSQQAGRISVYHDRFVGTGGTVANRIWYHLVVTRAAGGAVTAYLNGDPIFTGSDTRTMAISNDLLIGSGHTGDPANPAQLFNGKIDEVAFYDRALSATEVTRHFQAALNPPEAITFAGLIQTDIETAMRHVNSSVYVRIPFNVADPGQVDRLALRMKYDDGFVAYLNGIEVTAANAADSNQWNSAATQAHANSQAVVFEEIDISDARGALRAGANVLALQGLNVSATNSDFLLLPELAATSTSGLAAEPRYFRVPTPGGFNSVGEEDLGPILGSVGHTPALPAKPLDSDNIIVTAKVAAALAPVASVELRYRVMYGPVVALPMRDDGLHGDGAAGDLVYGATIPASASTPGQMVRYYVLATDAGGRTSRWPLFDDPQRTPEYLGTVIANPSVTSALLIWEWFAQNVSAARNRTGTRGSVFLNGRFYDNVRIRRRGGATTVGQKFDFNPGDSCFINEEVGDVREANLNNQGSDPSFIRPLMAFESFRVAGNPACLSFNMLMRVNGSADRVGVYVEQVDESFLARNGMDEQGALYKFVQRSNLDPIFSDPNIGVEKKTRQDEGRSDLQAVTDALALSNSQAARRTFIFDNFNVPALLTHLACRAVTRDADDVRKNIYMYRDTRGNGEWTILSWDKDWTFGITGDGGTWLRHPFFADQAHPKQNANQWSLLYHAVFTDPYLSSLYLRRLRTVMDQQLQPPGTPASSGYFESRADAWFAPASPHLGGSAASGVNSIKNFLPGRRTDLYVTYAETNTAAPAGNRLIPPAQPPNVDVLIGDLDYNPASGNQAEEYIELRNPNPFAVDISGWQITGGVTHTFRPGTVIGSNNVLYATPDVVAFRARATGPRGGQGLFVQGNYRGQLSARGETVELVDPAGRLVDAVTYPGTPSPAQQYLRITELMYHPAPWPGHTNAADAFEYVKLKNLGPAPLDLAGVRFVNGINFSFPAGTLASGQTVLVVRDAAAFAARYGSGLNVAGAYTNNFDNGGERIQLVDAGGEEILDFSYRDNWYPITDGLGFALVVVDETAEPDAWDRKANWRAGSQLHGAPGAEDPGPPAVAPVVVNEALTRSEGPLLTDYIELYNPTTNAADLSGWFLTDDFGLPQKFRLTNGTVIAAGGYLVIDEAQFNPFPGVPPSFALSSFGDEVYLFSGDAQTNLTGYVHGFDFGAAAADVAFGRYVTSTGEEQFVAQLERTPGAVNTGPRVGPVVISEIMYRPPDAGTNDNSRDEFIELVNRSSNRIELFDPLRPTNTWRLTKGVDLEFPPGLTLEPGERLLAVNFDPQTNAAAAAAFSALYGVPGGVKLLGPYGGKLDNSGESVQLKRPTTPGPGGVPYVLVDKVSYRDERPWPAGADGYGLSLQRIDAAAYGNDPINWVAAPPTATGAYGGGAVPVITQQPQSQTALAFTTVNLSVSATNGAPLQYQWRHRGRLLDGATNAVLHLENLQPAQRGDYRVVVFNAAGSEVSEAAQLTVLIAVTILNAPEDVRVRIAPDPLAAPTTNATFRVQAQSSAPLSFQWRFAGMDIPGATSDTLTIIDVQAADWGPYTVAISDGENTVETTPAWLYPLVQPAYEQTPLSQSVVAGGSVTLSAQISGWPPPFTFEWRRLGDPTFASIEQNEMASYFTLTAPASPTLWRYRVSVRNEAAPAGVVSPGFTTITVLADGDGDGLPDAWETEHSVDDPNDDPDHDSQTNREEYLAGTDPNNGSSYLKVERVELGGSVTVTFGALANRTYSVLYKEALDEAVWQKLADVLARANDREETIVDPVAPEATRYYRIVTPAQP